MIDTRTGIWPPPWALPWAQLPFPSSELRGLSGTLTLYSFTTLGSCRCYSRSVVLAPAGSWSALWVWLEPPHGQPVLGSSLGISRQSLGGRASPEGAQALFSDLSPWPASTLWLQNPFSQWGWDIQAQVFLSWDSAGGPPLPRNPP